MYLEEGLRVQQPMAIEALPNLRNDHKRKHFIIFLGNWVQLLFIISAFHHCNDLQKLQNLACHHESTVFWMTVNGINNMGVVFVLSQKGNTLPLQGQFTCFLMALL